MATIAIVTPIYATPENGRLELFDQTLRSVARQQTNLNIVHIIVDDGSPVDVEGFIKSYHEPRFRYVRRERMPGDLRTASNAMNNGIDYALQRNSEVFTKSEANGLGALCLLYSDDLLPEDSIEKRFGQVNGGFVYTDVAFFDNDRRIVRVKPGNFFCEDSKISNGNFYEFNHHTIMWDINFIRQLKEFARVKYNQKGIFDPMLSFGEDGDVSLSSFEVALNKGINTTYHPFVSYFFRLHSKTITGESSHGYIKSQYQIVAGKHPDYKALPIKSICLHRLLADVPWSLFTFIPESAKEKVRPIRHSIKKRIQGTDDGEIVSKLEAALTSFS